MSSISVPALAGFVFLECSISASAQSSGAAGTIDGVVTDPAGSVVPGAKVELSNSLSGYRRATVSDAAGGFHFLNVPPNPYRMSVSAAGFAMGAQDVAVRSSVPVALKIALALAGEHATVTVEAGGAAMLENVPYAHSDVDQALYSKLPASAPGAGLSDAITRSSPGVVADSNGLFHPLGDHAQTSYAIDGQPISDQQSKQFSTQIPLNAIQSMELITGAPAAEFGDKTSLVVNAVTRSGLGQNPFGSFVAQYGSFGSVGEEATLGLGGKKFGNFLSANALRSGRFLDSPEFRPYHDAGNTQTVFDRLDWQPATNDVFHLNLLAARNWFQVPNTLDQPEQDQRQKVLTYNVAPGYQHTFGAGALLSVNAFLRHDQVDYYPSRDPFADTPATMSESRRLTNYGLRADYSYVHKIHNVKVGAQFMQTRLGEQFALGVTQPGFVEDQPGLQPFDLTAGGSLFHFNGHANVNEYAFYVQDTITLKRLTLNAGLRLDRYRGLSQATSAQPRLGASYLLKATGTVLRAAYSRTLETPYNENLILASSTGSGGLAANVFGAFGARPIEPGRRNQYNVGLQQSLTKYVQVDADYFWKFTDNAFDFGTLLNTPLVFPISWQKSKIDGVSVRASTTEYRGFQAFATMGHTRSRYFAPSNGGLLFNSPLDSDVFRIDHDQAFQQTTQVIYRRPKNGPWVAFTARYDSGLVAGAVSSLDDALALTGAQQAAIGFYCGGVAATPANPIAACAPSNYGATRLVIPAAGTADADHNPPRIAPRHLFDLGAGTDNLFHAEKVRTTLKLSVTNLTNKVALYNFLSTFSGTHFVTPRAWQMELGWAW
ncbi:MAG: TonB-dependent receptor [Candidatus Solibacter sp.]